MFQKRIIPTILLSRKRAFKTINFNKRIYLGDPVNIIRIFNEKEVDELIIIDIDNTINNDAPDIDFISELSNESFIPMSYGGGISNLDEAINIISSGIEKISIQNLFFKNRKEFDRIIKYLDSSSVILSLDIYKNNEDYYLYDYTQKTTLRKFDTDIIDKINDSGAGEFLINFVNNDGKKKGLEKDLLKKFINNTNAPIIYGGGAKNLKDMQACLQLGASAISGGAIFTLHGNLNGVLIDYPKRSELSHILNN